MVIKAVLFDADGVLQNPTARIRCALGKLLADQSSVDKFIADIVAVERTCLTGQGDFVSDLKGVLVDWQSRATIEEALQVWTTITPDENVLEVVRSLRAHSIKVALATNQQSFRANHMKKTLGYDEVFNMTFYSCDLGLAKPAPEYFSLVVDQLEVRANEVLFFDDQESNVMGARSAGLHAEIFELDKGVGAMIHLLQDYNLNL
ncbi:MAG TPA: HAD-IA family hydrolase [Pseudomonadales bacterium]|jgi:putative hydrolase of the HAD superfamily|nr:HAD family hydrolase [Gammaproteobacteria bacterium]MDP6027335.1 HAD-IA family hydrolase [Pseudomonadales bacterium]MBP17943.1 HAD family hydrolase [Gammaproteobacteria bacterium]MDP6317030.1 HAD-IA family hydrolase [Pseudomonadales bacterium]MDP7316205.1 HAD-IA family hydrolase [Pseudomonadales bacterium]|tara:strand:- start:129 stop:740 length:612 start_codon:yes stop_codon:yes gene_type:complete